MSKPVSWQEFNPRAFPAPTVALVNFGHRDGEPRYCVAGTDYGYLHNASGDIRTWRSYSGARRVCKAYIDSHKEATE